MGKQVSGLESGFSSATALAKTEIAFLLKNMQTRVYRFDAEGVKKTKKQKSVNLPLKTVAADSHF